MSIEIEPRDTAAPTPLQRAIQARARETLAAGEAQGKHSPRRKLATIAATVVAVLVLIVGIDFAVRVMHHILIVWYGAPGGAAPAPQSKPLGPDQPMYITVKPAPEDSSP